VAAPTDGVPVGLGDQVVGARAAAQMGKHRQRAKRAVPSKERPRWGTSRPVTQHAIPATCRVVGGADRDAARSPLFAAARWAGVDVRIRAAQHRRMDADPRVVDEALAAAPVRGTLTIDVPQRDERPARRAQVVIRWTCVRRCPPQHANGWAPQPHMPGQVGWRRRRRRHRASPRSGGWGCPRWTCQAGTTRARSCAGTVPGG